MRFLLDTNICIYVIKGQRIDVIDELKKYPVADLGVSTITIAELEFGAAKSSKPERNREAIAEFMAPLEPVDFDSDAAVSYGLIRAHLESHGTPIGGMDCLIAAQALSRGLTIITNNVREFKRVPHLKVINWCK